MNNTIIASQAEARLLPSGKGSRHALVLTRCATTCCKHGGARSTGCPHQFRTRTEVCHVSHHHRRSRSCNSINWCTGEWYRGLARPSWTPPNWAFPLVWSILYIAIGISGWLVWEVQGTGIAIGLWLLQLVFNAAWSWLFFGLHRMDLAFVDICLLLLTILAYIAVASTVSPLAALLFAPYAGWRFS